MSLKKKRCVAWRGSVFVSRGDPPKRIFSTARGLIVSGQATLSVAARVLGFSPQPYYKWRSQPLSERERQDHRLLEEIGRIHRDDPEFGYRFIADELRAKGLCVSERKVWKLCSQAGIFSQILPAKCKSRKAGPAVGDDRLQRHFHAERPNVAWVVDITEHWTGTGKVYVCALKDVYSRCIVGGLRVGA